MRRISADRYRAPAELAGRVLVLLALGYALVQLTMDLTSALRDGMLSYGPSARLSWYAGAALWAAAATGLYLWTGRVVHHVFGPVPVRHVVADGSDDPVHVDDCPGCAAGEPATVSVLPAGNKTGERV